MAVDLTYHVRKNNLVPIIITICMGVSISVISIFAGGVATQIGGGDQGIGNALIIALMFLIPGIVGGGFILYLVKSDRENILEKMIMGIFLFTSTLIIFLVLYDVLVIFRADTLFIILIIIIACIVGVYLSRSLSSENDLRKNIAILALGSLLGAFLGIYIPLWTTIIMLALYSVYDIWAVKKGTIKKIFDHYDEKYNIDSENESSTSNEDKILEFEIGLGDLVFYTMFSTSVFYSVFWIGSDYLVIFLTKFYQNNYILGLISSLIPFILVTVSVIVGAKITFYLLLKSKMLPGLPISIGLGIASFLLCTLVYIFL